MAGGSESLRKARSAGSDSTPVSTPFSQRSHQRSVSCRKPIDGPGARPRSGYWCDQGPTMPFAGPGRFSTRRSTASRYGSAQPPTASTAASIDE
ncbi:hypothetical protein CMMCA002_01280 [Clavibacter michiganensis subsp. michiganensis]|nr:hypothetical protein CMMCA002_01280 [Clavibacter michiganensis subsp. michiganensis]